MSAEPVTGAAAAIRLPGDGVVLAGRRWPGDGVPIVAVHGLSSHALFYVGVGERLAGRRPLLSLDLRGRGESDKPEGDAYGIARHADDVAAAMRAADVERAVVVGHSMGAGVVTLLALRHPDLCAGVVLFDGGLQIFHDFFARPELAAEFMASSKGIEGRLHSTFAGRAEYEAYWQGLGVFTDAEWGPWAAAYVDHDLGHRDGGDGRVRCRAEAVAYDALDLVDASRAHGDEAVPVPVLAVHATAGILHGTAPLVQPSALERMAATHPVFDALEVPATNHYTIALTDPAATTVADALVRFAERCGA